MKPIEEMSRAELEAYATLLRDTLADKAEALRERIEATEEAIRQLRIDTGTYTPRAEELN